MARFDIRTSEEVKEMLKAIADKDNRSMTQEIEYLIKNRYEELLKGGK